MVVEFMLRGLKTEIDTDTIISLLKAGKDIENEYIIGVIQELVAKCKALEPLNVSILDLLSIIDKQTKEIKRLEAELKQLKEENESLKNDKAELLLAIENGKDDLGKTVDYLNAIINGFTDCKENKSKEFDWDSFKVNNIAVNCRTPDEAIDFIKSAKKYVKKWYDGDRIENNTYWSVYKEETCYFYRRRAKGLLTTSLAISRRVNREILEWSDYMVGRNEEA